MNCGWHVVAAVVLLGCGDSTELIVDVQTDLVAGVEFSGIDVRVGGERVSTLARRGDDWSRGLRAATFEGVTGTVRIDVDALKDGELVLTTSALVSVDGRVAVTIVMTRSCLNIDCAAEGAAGRCFGGQCVDQLCTDGTQASCDQTECDERRACAAVECAEAFCSEGGVCLVGGSTCGGDAYCLPETGQCVDIVRPEDAGGPLDGGAADAAMDPVDGGQDVAQDVGPPPLCEDVPVEGCAECHASSDCDDGSSCTDSACIDHMCEFTQNGTCTGPIVSIASGADHVCVLRSTGPGNGAIWCWGRNPADPLAMQPTIEHLVLVPNITDAVQVTAGDLATCALRVNGTVWCWGGNQFGTLGDGTNDLRILPVQVRGLDDAVAVELGHHHGCAVRQSGGVVCWGRNSRGELGDGTQDDSAVPLPVPVAGVVEVAPGWSHTCARTETGEVWCWGSVRGDGESGIALTPVQVLGVGDAVQLSAGSTHSCVRRSNNQVWCWGSNGSGQIGDGTTGIARQPAQVAGLNDVVLLASRDDHNCVARADGSVWCWGGNQFGQLGADTEASFEGTPVQALSVYNVTHLALGEHHSCSHHLDGSTWCWGSNEQAQLGTPLPDGRRPQLAPGITDAISVDVSFNHSCAARSTGAVACWGFNLAGQLGDGTLSNHGLAGTVLGTGDQVTTGLLYSCMLRDSAVWCAGRIGEVDSATPERVDGFAGAVASVAGGGQHVCARMTAGGVACWGGANHAGQIGDGSNEARLRPTPVVGIDDATHLGAGGDSACVVRNGGTVWCWGSNHAGALGDGTTTSRNAPVQAVGIVDATQVETYGGTTCVLDGRREVQCWGSNNDGKLGDGTVDDRLTPAVVPGLSDVRSISVGVHLCAVRNDGQLFCWGENRHGEVGDGSVDDQLSPALVVDIPAVLAVGAGVDHTCAVRDDGRVMCWGLNARGQLGIRNLWEPVRVVGL